MPKKGKESQQLTPEVKNHEDRLNNLEKRENAETTRLYDRLQALEEKYSASIFINTEDIKEIRSEQKEYMQKMETAHGNRINHILNDMQRMNERIGKMDLKYDDAFEFKRHLRIYPRP